ncbi:MAG: toxin-antitoxin system YwqK family antitoxin [Saprospiraceae bacterium]|nr:toxin-antitoxin system YwqK family antitoxin [Bacteroidia bacterium]NNE14718.1 toxin-antitoxin system YwqK family antitoxin [Saprospiraceae bacterium]NNL93752.1 toxin-antitoxin system YwqK family antitoxin [Saprospiraceae bacterium]
MKSAILFSMIVCLMACQGQVNSGATADLKGYTTSIDNGSTVTRATKVNAAGDLIEQGFVSGGKRNGVWLTYYEGDNAGKIKTLASYSDGLLSGPYLEFSNRGQIETEVNYANNNYHGKFAKYKFGRVVSESNYNNNMLDGLLKEYDDRGKLHKEITYKNGKQDGIMRYFNEEGEVTLEYVYKDGKKVSGGIVNDK